MTIERPGALAAAPGHRPLGRRDLPGALASGDRRGTDYVLITSWNEWHEGTEVEPSIEYGSRILDDTAAFSREFLARQR
jgi:hypothetical protein